MIDSNTAFSILDSILGAYLWLILNISLPIYLFQNRSSNEISALIKKHVLSPVVTNPKKAKSIRRTITLSIVCIFIFLVVASIPPLRDALIKYCFSKQALSYIKENNDLLSSWCDFSDILLTCGIVFIVGGVVFTDSFSGSVKDKLSRYEKNTRSNLRRDVLELICETEVSTRKCLRRLHLIALFQKRNNANGHKISLFFTFLKLKFNFTTANIQVSPFLNKMMIIPLSDPVEGMGGVVDQAKSIYFTIWHVCVL